MSYIKDFIWATLVQYIKDFLFCLLVQSLLDQQSSRENQDVEEVKGDRSDCHWAGG